MHSNSPRSNRWSTRILNPKRLHAMDVRAKVESGIREFFLAQGFRETRTPLLVPCPGMEPHIRPIQIQGGGYLPTSPEFAMKRLLVGGLEKIFQICPAFRKEPVSNTHLPEFTLLEWYRAHATYEQIMQDTENLIYFLTHKLFNKNSFPFQGKEIAISPPWPRFQIRDLFLKYVNIDLVKSKDIHSLQKDCVRLGLNPPSHASWDDLYFLIWLNLIEPKLPQNQAFFVNRYPASQAALSIIEKDPDGSEWAKRFEFYMGGLELGNAFEELTDPEEQRRRFIKDMELRERTYGENFPKTPLDEEFLEALAAGMPPASGIAVGVDRLVMLFADTTHIDDTFWLKSHPQE